MRVALITDSSACLVPDSADSPEVTVLPVIVHLPDADVADGSAGAAATIYDALAVGAAVKSSAPIAPDYLAAIEASDADAVVIVTPAFEFTTMHRHAAIALEMAGRPGVVVDSRTAAAAQGLVVAAALSSIRSGGGLETAVEAAEDAARRAELLAKLESVASIRASGRVASGALRVVDEADARPVFRLLGGVVQPVEAQRGDAAALDRIRREYEAHGGRAADGGPEDGRSPSDRVVFHALRADQAEDLRDRLGIPAPIVEFSPSIGIHTGPGVVGVAWLRPPAH